MRERFHTTIDGKLKKDVQLIAIEKGVNVNDIIESLLTDYIKKHKGGKEYECNKSNQ